MPVSAVHVDFKHIHGVPTMIVRRANDCIVFTVATQAISASTPKLLLGCRGVCSAERLEEGSDRQFQLCASAVGQSLPQ